MRAVFLRNVHPEDDGWHLVGPDGVTPMNYPRPGVYHSKGELLEALGGVSLTLDRENKVIEGPEPA